jgi:hypothetical protein
LNCPTSSLPTLLLSFCLEHLPHERFLYIVPFDTTFFFWKNTISPSWIDIWEGIY